MEIDYLANRRELIPEITELLYGQWADLFQAGGTSKEKLSELLMERAVTDRLPITVVALIGNELVGTGSIKLAEPGTKVGLSPWLAGMYVKEAHRGSGVGAAIVQALEATATELGFRTLYLSVGAAKEFYSRLGWTVIEHVKSYGVKDVALMAKELSLDSGTAPNNSFKSKPLRDSA